MIEDKETSEIKCDAGADTCVYPNTNCNIKRCSPHPIRDHVQRQRVYAVETYAHREKFSIQTRRSYG